MRNMSAMNSDNEEYFAEAINEQEGASDEKDI
jgi:hypothetical protein